MAIDKVSGVSPNFAAIFNSGVSLEDALNRLDEQVARYTPDVVRKRLKRGLANVQLEISELFIKDQR
jgi:hypothetical protein